jgi:hypothetical protein
MSDVQAGDKFQTQATAFLNRHGYPPGVDYVVTCTDGDKISLRLLYAHGASSEEKVTVVASFFGANFAEDRAQTLRLKTYQQAGHFFPQACASKPILPTKLKELSPT